MHGECHHNQPQAERRLEPVWTKRKCSLLLKCHPNWSLSFRSVSTSSLVRLWKSFLHFAIDLIADKHSAEWAHPHSPWPAWQCYCRKEQVCTGTGARQAAQPSLLRFHFGLRWSKRDLSTGLMSTGDNYSLIYLASNSPHSTFTTISFQYPALWAIKSILPC